LPDHADYDCTPPASPPAAAAAAADDDDDDDAILISILLHLKLGLLLYVE
jgi:hypothetical protein